MEGRHRSKQALKMQAESSQRTLASMGKRSRERRKRVLAAARAAKRQQDATTTTVAEESQNVSDLDDDQNQQHQGADGPDLARPRKRSRAQVDKGTGRPEEGDHRDTKPETNSLAHPSSSSPSCAARTDDDDDDGGKNKDRAAIIEEGLAWLQNKDAVSMHLSKIDLVEKLEHAGGLVRIENFLPSAAAEAALHILETLPESRWEVRRDADDTQRNATAHRFYVASARGRKDPLALVRRAVQNLLPEKKAVISAGRYSAGDHIAPHDDLGYHREDGKLWSRDVAVIFYLTKDWTKADGGTLLDLDPGAQRSSYVPLFNSLVSFVVPREHAVTAVRPRIGRAPRYSLFGWFLVEGDLYRFEPESHGKNAAKKAKTRGGNSQVGNRAKNNKGRGKTKRNGRR